MPIHLCVCECLPAACLCLLLHDPVSLCVHDQHESMNFGREEERRERRRGGGGRVGCAFVIPVLIKVENRKKERRMIAVYLCERRTGRERKRFSMICVCICVSVVITSVDQNGGERNRSGENPL